ncbi:MAG: hypothetical protein ACYTE6_14965 [Planctomycetota bacterium]|jgi:hypothetical protein
MVMLLSSEACFALAILCLIWGVVSAVRITVAVHERGVRIHPILLNVLILKYVYQYRVLTLAETGRTGGLFYSYIFAMNLALLSAITGLVVRAAWGF